MSHVTATLCPITDIDCLKRVVAKTGLKWMEGQETYTFFGRFLDDWGKGNEHRTARARGVDPSQYGKCEHAIRVPGGSYEIGVTKRQDGEGYSLVWDVWRGDHINKAIGKDGEILMASYNEEYISSYAQANGYMLQEEVNSDGNLVMTLLQ